MSATGEIIKMLPFSAHGYEFQSLIGRGTYGCVVKAVHKKRGHVFAAKIVKCDQKQNELRDMIASEVNCMLSLLHPNVIKIYDQFSENDFLFLILEMCSKGSLEQIIHAKVQLTEVQLLSIMRQLLNAVYYCHSQGIAHRDIKPANIMIAYNGSLKLSDFGLGIQLKGDEMLTDYTGSFVYKAPELLKKEKHCPFMSDIWSLGVTFYHIATGSLPWGRNKSEYESRILLGRVAFPSWVPLSVANIIKQMIVVNPIERASIEHLLSESCFSMAKTKPGNYFSNRESKKIHNGIKVLTQTKSKRRKSFMANSAIQVFK